MQNPSSQPPLSSLIYLPKSLVAGKNPDNFEIVYSVTAFTHDMRYKGLYRPDELPTNAMQLYYVDYYFGEVMNGGHSQFIENAFEDGLLDIISTALEGFVAMGGGAHADVLTEMSNWLQETGFLEQFAEESGFDDDVWEFLEELDARLGEAHEEMPIEDLQARWLLGWENLRIVEDGEIQPLREAQLKSNPMLFPRKIRERISRFGRMMRDPRDVGLALAAASLTPGEILLSAGMGERKEIDGVEQYWQTLKTTGGQRLAPSSEDDVQIFAMDAQGECGEELSNVSRTQIERLIAYPGSSRVALATEAFLQSHHPELEWGVELRPFTAHDDQPPIFSIKAGEHLYLLSQIADGFKLTKFGNAEVIDIVSDERLDKFLLELRAQESGEMPPPNLRH